MFVEEPPNLDESAIQKYFVIGRCSPDGEFHQLLFKNF